MSKEGKWDVNEEGNDEAKLLGRGTSIRGEERVRVNVNVLTIMVKHSE